MRGMTATNGLMRAAFLAAVLAWAAIAFPRPAAALSITPPVFEVQASPGQTIVETLRLFNDGSEPIAIASEFANFTHKADDEVTGAPELYPADEVRDGRGLAPWMRVVNAPKTLAPGERGYLEFEIRVPSDADPGGRFGAVVIQPGTEAPGSGVGVIGNVAALVILRIEGEVVEDLGVTSLAPSRGLYARLPAEFSARVENRGTVHARPHGILTITDLFGRVAAVLPVNVESKGVLPGSARRYAAVWSKSDDEGGNELVRQWRNFAIGRYTATLELRYGSDSKRATAETAFWVFPWLVVLLGAAVVAAGAGALFLWLRWYARKVIERHEREKTS